MKKENYWEKTVEELLSLVKQARAQLVQLQREHAKSQLKGTTKLRVLKDSVARILTVISEKRDMAFAEAMKTKETKQKKGDIHNGK